MSKYWNVSIVSRSAPEGDPVKVGLFFVETEAGVEPSDNDLADALLFFNVPDALTRAFITTSTDTVWHSSSPSFNRPGVKIRLIDCP